MTQQVAPRRLLLQQQTPGASAVTAAVKAARLQLMYRAWLTSTAGSSSSSSMFTGPWPMEAFPFGLALDGSSWPSPVAQVMVEAPPGSRLEEHLGQVRIWVEGH
jgi:hypothetical protein